MNCTQPGCSGEITDGYCSVCGMAPQPVPAAGARPHGAGLTVGPARRRRRSGARAPAPRRGEARTAAISAPAWWRCRRSPTGIPSSAVMADPNVAESRRFCASCRDPSGADGTGHRAGPRGSAATAARPSRSPPSWSAGDLVAGQYEVAGCLAHGGLGWIYLARDRNVADRWVVLKGLLDSGDEDAMAAALAERRFLAEVEHPNIVKIFNFVEHRRLRLHRHGVRRRRQPEGLLSQQARGERRRNPTRCPSRRRSPTCWRSSRRSGTCTERACCSATSSPTTSSRRSIR